MFIIHIMFYPRSNSFDYKWFVTLEKILRENLTSNFWLKMIRHDMFFFRVITFNKLPFHYYVPIVKVFRL